MQKVKLYTKDILYYALYVYNCIKAYKLVSLSKLQPDIENTGQKNPAG